MPRSQEGRSLLKGTKRKRRNKGNTMRREEPLLRRVRIRLGRAEIELTSEKDDIKELNKMAEDFAKKIKLGSSEKFRYIG